MKKPSAKNKALRALAFLEYVLEADHAAMQSIDALMKFADAGDERALRALHGQATAITTFLNNEKRVSFADTVTEWPVMVRRSKDDRGEDLKRAKELRIGGTATGGQRQQPHKFSPGSQRHFALGLLDLVRFARRGVQSLGKSYPRKGDRESVDLILQATGLERCEKPRWTSLLRLPDYCPESRKEWIAVMTSIATDNPALVPKSIRDLSTRTERISDGAGGWKTVRILDVRGLPAVIRQKLESVLKGLDQLPD